jgi:hypothetical protein
LIALREKNPGFDERKMDDLIVPNQRVEFDETEHRHFDHGLQSPGTAPRVSPPNGY